MDVSLLLYALSGKYIQCALLAGSGIWRCRWWRLGRYYIIVTDWFWLLPCSTFYLINQFISQVFASMMFIHFRTATKPLSSHEIPSIVIQKQSSNSLFRISAPTNNLTPLTNDTNKIESSDFMFMQKSVIRILERYVNIGWVFFCQLPPVRLHPFHLEPYI